MPTARRTSVRSRRHVALLRGINVGGKNKLPMKALVALMEELGAQEVRTYIQSGNVVFGGTATLAKAMAKKLPAAIADAHGLTVPVVIRSAAEFRDAVDSNPYADDDLDPKLLHVGFLAAKPTKAAGAALDPDRSPPDTFVLRGRELYLHFPNGAARTKLTSAYLDRTLGTTTTARNWRTVERIMAMLEE